VSCVQDPDQVPVSPLHARTAQPSRCIGRRAYGPSACRASSARVFGDDSKGLLTANTVRLPQGGRDPERRFIHRVVDNAALAGLSYSRGSVLDKAWSKSGLHGKGRALNSGYTEWPGEGDGLRRKRIGWHNGLAVEWWPRLGRLIERDSAWRAQGSPAQQSPRHVEGKEEGSNRGTIEDH